MARRVRSHTFRGKRYSIQHVSPSKLNSKRDAKKYDRCLGLCEPPTKKKKRILLDNTIDGLEELRVTLHEAQHACHWDMCEEAVDDSTWDMAKFLWRLGYRKVQ